MKRIFSIFLTLCMLAALFVVPTYAYKTAGADLWPSEWHADLNITFSGKTAAPLGNLYYTQSSNVTDATVNPDIAADANGYLYLNTSLTVAAPTNFLRTTLEAGQVNTTNNNFVTDEGSTIDLAVKFRDLPKATSEIIKIDPTTGEFATSDANGSISSNARGQMGRYLGFTLNVHSVADFINPDGSVKVHPSGTNKDKPYSTEYYISFVEYDNDVLGTNAAIIFISGSATGWTSWTTSVREVYFCNLDIGAASEYHRYTFTTDYSKGLAGEDMVTLYIDGEKATTFSAPAYRSYNATLGDYVNFGLNLNGYCETYPSTHITMPNQVTMSVMLDQLSIYGTALTPKDANPSTFNEEAPLYTEDYEDAIARAQAIAPDAYSKKSWKALEDALALADELPPVSEMAKPEVTQADLDAVTQAIEQAIDGLKFNDFSSVVDERRLMIPFSYYNATSPNGYAHAWTNSTILFSDPNYDVSEYKVNDMDLASFTGIVFEPTDVAGQYKATAVYKAGTTMANRAIKSAPAGGFMIYTHVNVPGTSNSRYASQLFGDENGAIVSQIKVGDLAVLENITLNDGDAATLVTTGDWRSRYDPTVSEGDATSTGDVCDRVMATYPHSGPVWRDVFEDFATSSALVMQIPVGADLKEYNEICGKIDAANPNLYTEESWAALNAVRDGIDLEQEGLDQDTIDGWVEELKAAFAALVGIDSDSAEDPSNPGNKPNTGDTTKVFITFGAVAFLAIACVAALVIGRRRGNF